MLNARPGSDLFRPPFEVKQVSLQQSERRLHLPRHGFQRLLAVRNTFAARCAMFCPRSLRVMIAGSGLQGGQVRTSRVFARRPERASESGYLAEGTEWPGMGRTRQGPRGLNSFRCRPIDRSSICILSATPSGRRRRHLKILCRPTCRRHVLDLIELRIPRCRRFRHRCHAGL